MKCVVYCRVSSASQNHTSSVSLHAQEVECNRVAARCGWVVRCIRKDIHSAFRSIPPELQNLIAGHRQTIIIYDVSRFSRSLSMGKAMMTTALANGNNIVFVQEKITVDSPQSAFAIIPFLVETQKESIRISERVRNSKKYLRDNGMHQGGIVPYGFEQRGRMLHEDEDEQDVVNFIRYCRTEGIESDKLNELMSQISRYNMDEHPIACYDERNDAVCQLTMTISHAAVAKLLNDYGVSKRGVQWNGGNVRSVNCTPVSGLHASWRHMSHAITDIEGKDNHHQALTQAPPTQAPIQTEGLNVDQTLFQQFQQFQQFMAWQQRQ